MNQVLLHNLKSKKSMKVVKTQFNLKFSLFLVVDILNLVDFHVCVSTSFVFKIM